MSRSNFVPGTFLPNDERDINKSRSMVERANWRTRTRSSTGDSETMCLRDIIKETEIYDGLGENKCQTTREVDLPQPLSQGKTFPISMKLSKRSVTAALPLQRERLDSARVTWFASGLETAWKTAAYKLPGSCRCGCRLWEEDVSGAISQK